MGGNSPFPSITGWWFRIFFKFYTFSWGKMDPIWRRSYFFKWVGWNHQLDWTKKPKVVKDTRQGKGTRSQSSGHCEGASGTWNLGNRDDGAGDATGQGALVLVVTLTGKGGGTSQGPRLLGGGTPSKRPNFMAYNRFFFKTILANWDDPLSSVRNLGWCPHLPQRSLI